MLRLLLDENFNNHVLRVMLKRQPDVDVLRVQDIEALAGQADPVVLEWAAQAGRVLLTHDIRTMNYHAYERVKAGLPMAGVIQVDRWASVSVVVEQLLFYVEAAEAEEFEGIIKYLPES